MESQRTPFGEFEKLPRIASLSSELERIRQHSDLQVERYARVRTNNVKLRHDNDGTAYDVLGSEQVQEAEELMWMAISEHCRVF